MLKRLAVAAILFYIITSTPVFAQIGWKKGKIVEIYADPSDIVLVLDQAGPCGSNFYIIRRNNQNFSEFTSLMYTAAASRQMVNLSVSACENDRNIISHGSAIFQ